MLATDYGPRVILFRPAGVARVTLWHIVVDKWEKRVQSGLPWEMMV